MKKILILSVFIIATLISCSKEEKEPIVNPPVNNCETEAMSFQNDVTPILQTNCLGCHSTAAAFGNIILDNYDEVSKVINAGRLLGSIKHESGFSSMPQNGDKLSDCDIDKIESWVEDGSPNN